MSVGLREGEATGAIDGLSPGAGVSTASGPKGGDGSVGAFVSLPLGNATGLFVGPSVDTPSGDCVGVFPDSSEGLREGDETGAIDRASTGAGVSTTSGPKGGDGSVGAFVSLPLGDATGLLVEPLVDPTAGNCVGLFPVMSVGLREGDETGGRDPLAIGASVLGKSGTTGREG